MDKLGCFLAGTITGVVGLGIVAFLSEKCGLLDDVFSGGSADKDDEQFSAVSAEDEVKATSQCDLQADADEKSSFCNSKNTQGV